MKIIVDMNLSPLWVEALESMGWDAVHWSTVGDMRAPDEIIMAWARENGYVVFTHDLDFGILLALTRAENPSVIQIRAQDILPEALKNRMAKILTEYEATLEKGALLTIDEGKARIRILPFA